MRQDLLALTLDDLVTLSNRGIVKRAQQELQSGQFTVEWEEDAAGTVTLRWSDPVECVLPDHTTVSNSHCSCPATSLCRHLIRSVLAYQQQATAPLQDAETPESNASPPAPAAIWNPGEISDADLTKQFPKTVLNKVKKQFEEGQVISLHLGQKPTAHIHTLSCTLRFLVPGDVRYTHCDCSEPAPCSHVPLAVWAFRLLQAEQSGGIVSTRPTQFPSHPELLDEIEQQLLELVKVGISGASPALMDRFRRLEIRCREQSWIWVAEVIADLLQEYESYAQHDARFSPLHVTALIAELCIRCDAIRAETDAVPQLFVRGAKSDRTIELGSARLVGLGCGAEMQRRNVRLNAYLQDVDSGTVMAVRRDFPQADQELDAAKPFWQLAQTPVVKGVNLANIGRGQLLVKGGKRTPGYEFLPGRSPISFNPQTYTWESLRAPVRVEDFTELRDRLQTLPPASLRPRRLTENFHVCQIDRVEAAAFHTADQMIWAKLVDPTGNSALLLHPYTSRGQAGAEALLARLTQPTESLKFVAGSVSLMHGEVAIAPVALVFEQANHRTLLQPWIDPWSGSPATAPFPSTPTATPQHPLVFFPTQLLEALSELFLIGLQRINAQTVRYWQELLRHGTALGFIRLLDPLNRLVTALHLKTTASTWDALAAAQIMLEVAVLVQIARESETGT